MDTKLKSNKKISILIAFLLITVAVAIFCVQYPVFKKNVEKYKVNILQSEGFLTNVYRGNAVLYRELTERVAGESVRYRDLFWISKRSWLILIPPTIPLAKPGVKRQGRLWIP